MNLFEAVKDRVTAREAAVMYGLHVKHNGMCVCPFHPDKNPSLKVSRRYHCFGCQADGDVIDFTARLFGLSPKDAAMKLAADFGISYDARIAYVPRKREPSDEEQQRQAVTNCYDVLCSYRHLLVKWQEQYAPADPEEAWHPLFMEAMANLTSVENALDVLLTGEDNEKVQVLHDYDSVLPILVERICVDKNSDPKEMDRIEINEKVPVYKQPAAYAREHGEIDQFRASHWANIACKNAIEDAIAEHFDGMHLGREAVTDVLEQFGKDRMEFVLAATVQVKSWDGRFSVSNKEWAASIPTTEGKNESGFDRRDEYAVSSHPAVLDGYVRIARQEMKELEKTSIHDALQQGAAKPMMAASAHRAKEFAR